MQNAYGKRAFSTLRTHKSRAIPLLFSTCPNRARHALLSPSKTIPFLRVCPEALLSAHHSTRRARAGCDWSMPVDSVATIAVAFGQNLLPTDSCFPLRHRTLDWSCWVAMTVQALRLLNFLSPPCFGHALHFAYRNDLHVAKLVSSLVRCFFALADCFFVYTVIEMIRMKSLLFFAEAVKD